MRCVIRLVDRLARAVALLACRIGWPEIGYSYADVATVTNRAALHIAFVSHAIAEHIA